MYQTGYYDTLTKLGLFPVLETDFTKESLDFSRISQIISQLFKRAPTLMRAMRNPALDRTLMGVGRAARNPALEQTMIGGLARRGRRVTPGMAWRTMRDPLPTFTPRSTGMLFPQTPKPVMQGGKLFWPKPTY